MGSATLLIVLAGLFIGLLLGLAGGGGSVVTVPLLVYVVHLPPKVAIVTSMGIVGVTSLVGLLYHAHGRNVAWKAGAAFGLTGMVGAYCGSIAAHYVADGLLLLLFAVIMLCSGLAMLRRPAPVPTDPALTTKREAPPQLRAFRLVTDGFLVGVVTGLVGVGGGFLVVPALTLLRGLSIHVAVGTSLLIIAMNCASGVITHRFVAGVPMDLHVASVISAFTVCGTLLGTRLCKSLSALSLKRGFGYLVLGVAIALIGIEGSRQLAPLLDISRLQAGILLCLLCGLVAARRSFGPLLRRAELH